MTHARNGITMIVALAIIVGAVYAQQKDSNKEVRQLAAAFSEAWESGDARAMAELFTDEGDLVLATGLKAEGRSKIESWQLEWRSWTDRRSWPESKRRTEAPYGRCRILSSRLRWNVEANGSSRRLGLACLYPPLRSRE
jgi:ketosteroid isomerase-like protein